MRCASGIFQTRRQRLVYVAVPGNSSPAGTDDDSIRGVDDRAMRHPPTEINRWARARGRAVGPVPPRAAPRWRPLSTGPGPPTLYVGKRLAPARDGKNSPTFYISSHPHKLHAAHSNHHYLSWCSSAGPHIIGDDSTNPGTFQHHTSRAQFLILFKSHVLTTLIMWFVFFLKSE